MSLSRQLRRAAERKLHKDEKRALKNPLSDSTALEQVEVVEQTDSGFDVSDHYVNRESSTVPKSEPSSQPTGSTGPRTMAGKAASCLNNLKHGLTGAFRVLQFESQSEFDAAHDALIAEHEPTTPTESELVRRMAEHAWLSRRAQLLQDQALTDGDDKKLSLYMRYGTTNDRGFRACLNDLFRLRREQRTRALQFESQNREAELHDARVRLANARAGYLEMDTDFRSKVDAPIPGYSSIPTEQIKELFKAAMSSLQYTKGGKAAQYTNC